MFPQAAERERRVAGERERQLQARTKALLSDVQERDDVIHELQQRVEGLELENLNSRTLKNTRRLIKKNMLAT